MVPRSALSHVRDSSSASTPVKFSFSDASSALCACNDRSMNVKISKIVQNWSRASNRLKPGALFLSCVRLRNIPLH